ncbi:unnamed protein product [Ixodes hexagonus]
MALNEPNLVKKLTSLTNTQDSVQTLSLWIIHHRAHHRKIVDIWAKVLKKSKPSHRLTMLYLANDVLQNGRRKGVQQYIESFGEVLPHQVPLFRDEKILKQVDRVFTIWSERSVYPSDFTLGLKDILHKRTGDKQQHHHHHHHHHHSSASDGERPAKEPSKKESGKPKNEEVEKIILEFKPEKVIEKIEKLKKVENDTVIKLAALTSRNMDVSSSEVLRKFKDRSHGQQFQKDFDDATRCLEEYIKALERELAERTEMTEMLEDAKVYYDSQHGEARIVATAYKNFGSRVKGLKRKLEVKMKTLPSPVPSPTPDAPSPTNSEDDDALQLPFAQDTESSLAPPLAEPVVVDNGEARAVMGLDGCSPQSAPSPEGSPVGLSPVLPGNGAANDVSGGPDGAEGGASALSSFMSQSPTLLSSWLDAFNQEFQESKAANTLSAALGGNSLLSVPSPSLSVPAVPSTLESRLSNLMQNMGQLPSGLFSSTSSASNTPRGQDSPLPYATTMAQMPRNISLEPHSTPLKDENSGQGTPVLDEDLGSAKQQTKKTAPVADTDLRVQPSTGSKTDSSESTPTHFGSAAFGSKIPTLGSPASWLLEGSPKTSAPALAPPPLPPALQAYLEPIRTVTTAGPNVGAEEGSSDLLPSPSADYLIPVADNFDVTDMELDDSGDEGDGHSHRKKAAAAASAAAAAAVAAAASNLITLVQPEAAANPTTTKEKSLEKPKEEPKSTTPASTLASTSSPALSSGMAAGAAAAQSDLRHLRELAEGGGYPSSPLTQPSKIETVQMRAIERSPPQDDVSLWDRRDYYDALPRSQQQQPPRSQQPLRSQQPPHLQQTLPPQQQRPQMSNGGNRMQERGGGGYYGYEMRPQPPPEHFLDDYDSYGGRGYEPDWQGLPPSPRYRHFNNGPPPPQQRPPYFQPRY